jgi:uncharacterized Zn-finger protein
MKCSNKQGHVYEQHDANTWKCVYCGKLYTFDDQSKGWK